MTNVLLNHSFENGANGHTAYVYTPNGAYVTERGEINTPRDWGIYYKHDRDFVPPWDPSNGDGWCEPEVVIIPRAAPYLNPPRVADGNAALKLFTTYRINHTGVFQCVPTMPGHALRLSALVHAWSSVDDDPYQSTGHGTAAVYAPEGAYGSDYGKGNFVFRVGIDPTGGTNPFAPSVVWGTGCHVYNAYAAVPPVVAIAEGNYVTVFVESRCHLRFKHNDAYFDNVVLEDVTGGGGDSGRGAPREQYEKVTYLMHPNATAQQWAIIANAARLDGVTVSASADDAGLGDLDSRRVYLVQFDDGPRFNVSDMVAWFGDYYPGVIVEPYAVGGSDPDDGGDGTPGEYDYPVVATGPKLYPHAIGEGGAYDILAELAYRGMTLPFCKVVATEPSQLQAVANLKALSPGTQFIARLMRVPDSGINIEGPDFSSDPAGYMGVLLPLMLAHPAVDYWELWNESDPVGAEGHVQMARFATDCMEIAEAAGVKLALMSYSTGVPEQSEWTAILNETAFFQTAQRGGHILSLHAYGASTDPNDVRYHILRAQYELYPQLVSAGIVVPYVLTEYAPAGGLAQWETGALMAEFAAVDALLAAQYYCLGACVFTFGLGWNDYNLNERWRPFMEMVYATRGRVNAQP